jgi:hypothetical protein
MISLLLNAEVSIGGEYLKNAYAKPERMRKERKSFLHFLPPSSFSPPATFIRSIDNEKKRIAVATGKKGKK